MEEEYNDGEIYQPHVMQQNA